MKIKIKSTCYLQTDSAHWLAKGGWHNADLYRKIVLKITDISTINLILKTHWNSITFFVINSFYIKHNIVFLFKLIKHVKLWNQNVQHECTQKFQCTNAQMESVSTLKIMCMCSYALAHVICRLIGLLIDRYLLSTQVS